jgi:cell division protein FtsQ
MHRSTHRRAFSHPVPHRGVRGTTSVHGSTSVRGASRPRTQNGARGSSSPRNARGVRPIRATVAARAPTLVLPKISAETWRAARPKVLALGLTVLLGALVFAFFNLDLFYVFEPDVIGLQNLSRDEIVRASGVTGYNVFFIDAGSVERTLSRMPEIKSVKVMPGVPNLLSIQITEREPVIVWQRGADMYWVDSEGIVFKPHGDKTELATIRDLDQTPVKAGSKATPKALAAYQALQTAMPEAPRQLEWSLARGLAFADERGWKIYLGDENGMTGKVVKYQALAQQLDAQKAQVKFIDLGKGDPYYQ